MEINMKKLTIALMVGALSLSTPAFAADVPAEPVAKVKVDKKAYATALKAIDQKYKAEIKSLNAELKAAKSITDVNVKAEKVDSVKAKIRALTKQRNTDIKALGKAPKNFKKSNNKKR
jgi:peptidoglycan hydrolase CwlO-like protein